MYSTRQARADIDAVYSMGLFDDVNILPQPAEDSTLENPKARFQIPPAPPAPPRRAAGRRPVSRRRAAFGLLLNRELKL